MFKKSFKFIKFIQERQLFLFVIVYSFFLFFILYTFRDYGISWDESFYLNSGKIYAENFFNPQKISELIPEYHRVSHGAFFDILYFLPLKIFSLGTNYEALHLIKGLFASLTIIFVFLSLRSINSRRYLALFGVILLIFFPRWLGDIFDNHMDITSALLYSAEIFIGIKLLSSDSKRSWIYLMVLGVISALSFSQRVALAFVPVVALVLFIQKAFQRKTVALVALFALTFMVFLYIFDPYIRTNGLEGIQSKIILSSKFLNLPGTTLFEGKFLSADSLPWYYLPKLILITTPVATLISLSAGLYFLLNRPKAVYILILAAFILPIGAVIVLKPVLFDSWRHILFISVPMVMIAALGLDSLLGMLRPAFKPLILIVFFLGLVSTAVDLYQLHPYEYVYFNQLVGGLKGAAGKYETDYWGKSNREAVNWLKEEVTDSPNIYRIKTCGDTVSSSYYFLPNMVLEDSLAFSDYYICTTRQNQDQLVGDRNIVYKVVREGVVLNYVKKVR